MTLQQLAKQLNIPVLKLEKETLRAYLLTKLGETEAKRQAIAKKYGVYSASDWDEKAREGKLNEKGYEGIRDFLFLMNWISRKKI